MPALELVVALAAVWCPVSLIFLAWSILGLYPRPYMTSLIWLVAKMGLSMYLFFPFDSLSMKIAMSPYLLTGDGLVGGLVFLAWSVLELCPGPHLILPTWSVTGTHF